jgi:hypothetical protein
MVQDVTVRITQIRQLAPNEEYYSASRRANTNVLGLVHFGNRVLVESY